jgi:carbon monoxide dehydrogenase subunit G
MKIDNQFRVSLPIGRAWEVLTDLPAIAPCMPGAQLTGSEGEVYSGTIKVKVGPVTTEYAGTATFAEKDPDGFYAVINAKGREARGAGNASATITAQLSDEGEHTLVRVGTDLKISGKVAQLGSGMIAEVSEKLLGQFVDCLETTLAASTPVAQEPDSPPTSTDGTERTEGTLRPGPEAQPVDLLQVAGGSVAKRLIPVVIGAIMVAVVIRLIAR